MMPTKKIRDEAKRGATSAKMLTNGFYRVVTLASSGEYIYWPIPSFESQIKKCQEEEREERDLVGQAPNGKSFVIISKVLPNQLSVD